MVRSSAVDRRHPVIRATGGHEIANLHDEHIVFGCGRKIPSTKQAARAAQWADRLGNVVLRSGIGGFGLLSLGAWVADHAS